MKYRGQVHPQSLRHRRRTLAERILLRLSREPDDYDYEAGQDHWKGGNALSQLCRFFPEFVINIAGKDILDFGCGTGHQSVALAQSGARYVVGIDRNRSYLEKSRELAKDCGVAHKVDFADGLNDSLYRRFDIVISQNSMEHFSDPMGVLNEMKAASRVGGTIFITFGCPWFSPYGSHMHFFVKVPWVNLIFDEKTVMNVRSYFRSDGATRYEQVEGGLNKMSVAKFEMLIRQCRLRVKYKQYECVKGLNFLSILPVFRELFVNNISCVLENEG